MIGAFSIFSHLLLSFLKHTAHYIRKQIKKKGGTYPSRRHLSMLFLLKAKGKFYCTQTPFSSTKNPSGVVPPVKSEPLSST